MGFPIGDAAVTKHLMTMPNSDDHVATDPVHLLHFSLQIGSPFQRFNRSRPNQLVRSPSSCQNVKVYIMQNTNAPRTSFLTYNSH